jgi:two-component sensor histidine kinase
VGLAIHELTTNAAKHGALCVAEGRVEVTWHLAEKSDVPALFCEWQEVNGPPVEPPKVSGFGSMLLKRVLSQQIRADVDVEYDPQGFRLRLVVPLEAGLKSAPC